MARYNSYKPSQIPWLNDIPSHWERKTLSQLTSEHKMSNKGVNHQNLLSLSYGRIVRKDINKTDGLLPASFEGYQIIEPGNIVLRLTDLQNDQKSLRVGLCHEEGIVTSAYVAIEPKPQYNPEYLYLLLHSYDILKVFYSMGGGIRQGLNYQGLSKIGVLLPPLEEQTKIVDFLTRKTTLIEAQQQEREREIQLLNELKQAEIANVVTKGVNPDVPMKDSGISWIGHIPEHWSVKYIFQFAKEHNISNKNIHHQNLLSLSYGKIIRKDINTTDGLLPESFDTYQVVEPGNIILRLTDLQNDHKSLRVGLVNEEGIITSAYVCLEIHTDFLPSYLYNLLHSYDLKKVFYSMGGGLRQNLNYQGLRKLEIILPPIEEQKAIVEYIRKKNSAIDDMIANLRAEIDFLTEYKQRLIADAVTGQIKID